MLFDYLGDRRVRMAVTFAGPPPRPVESIQLKPGLETFEMRLGFDEHPNLVVSSGFDRGRTYWTVAEDGSRGTVVKQIKKVTYNGNTAFFDLDLDGLIGEQVDRRTAIRLQVEAIRVVDSHTSMTSNYLKLAAYPTRDCPAYPPGTSPPVNPRRAHDGLPIDDDPY